MDRLATYALVAAIGEITKPTKEERNREGDRWVALRTLSGAPTTIQSEPQPQQMQAAAPEAQPPAAASAPAAAPAPAPRKPVFYAAIQQRHLDARRKIGL
jgi:hypothetical protein